MSTRYHVCGIDDLHRKTTGAEVETNSGLLSIIILRIDNKISAYVNKCPHTGVNLEWRPHQFLDTSGNFLQCATHGALFELGTGACIQGPCNGQFLTPIETEIEADEIYITFKD